MVEARILLILKEYGELNSFQICRLLNKRDIRDCREVEDLSMTYYNYGRYGGHYACKFCEIPYSKVLSTLNKLIKKGLVKKERRRVHDPACNRGYDFWNIYSLTDFARKVLS